MRTEGAAAGRDPRAGAGRRQGGLEADWTHTGGTLKARGAEVRAAARSGGLRCGPTRIAGEAIDSTMACRILRL